jgi:hypothetical protein
MNRPERIYNVSKTQLSIARFYGGCKFQGVEYHYDAESDTLTRMDVWKERIAIDKEAGNKAAKAERDKGAMMDKQANTENEGTGGPSALSAGLEQFNASRAKQIASDGYTQKVSCYGRLWGLA